MTPAAVEAKYGVPPARYPELAAIVGETSDNLPGVPGVGPGFAARWLNEYDGLDNVITHADKITGKKGEALREHLGDVIRNRQLNALVCDLDLELRPEDLQAQSWDRQMVHTLFDSLEFRVLRERLLESWDVQHEEIDESGFELAGARLGQGEVAGWLAEHTGEGRTGVTVQGRWGSGSGEVWSVALAAADGTGAWFDAAEVTPEDDAAVMTWFDDPGHDEARQGAPRRQGPDARAGGARLAAARTGQRHRPGGVPRPARPALLRPGRPDAALPQARAQAGRHRRRPADLRRPRRLGRHRRHRHRDAARPRGRRPRRRARPRDRGARRHPPAGRGGAAAHRPAGADGADRHRRRRRPPAVAGGGVRRRREAGGRGGVRRDRQGDQPRLAQAAPGRAVRRARDAQDQAHQDRLHHRRRRARRVCWPRSRRARRVPSSSATCSATATSPGCGRRSRGSSRPSPTTAGSTRRSTS